LRAAARSRLTLGLLRDCLSPFPAPGLALAARGSLARGDLGPCSDLDLVLLCAGRRDREARRIVRRLRRLPWRIGAQVWRPAGGDGPRGLASWTTAVQMRYVAGDATLFWAVRDRFRRRLGELAPSDLDRLHRFDPRRHQGCFDQDSWFSFNLKRGPGGTVDHDFLRILWAHPEGRRLCAASGEPLVSAGAGSLMALTLLKDALHRRSRMARENYYDWFRSGDDPLPSWARRRQTILWHALQPVLEELRR